MCGIAGELRFTGCSSPKADWDKISSMMARRGPDDAGLWTDHQRCIFVFRRLAIIDLSPNGHQPITAHHGRYVLVFNGEVYNFKTLRKRLENRGVVFRSTSDSEVVLHALIEWGVAALDQFNGMFALGFYDSLEKRLLLARDHAGIKPLYYLMRPEGIVFASQYNQIMAHPWSQNVKVSHEALALYLRFGYIPAPFGLFTDSHMLEPGSWIQVTEDGHIQEGRFFEFPYCETPSLKGREAIEAVDAAVTDAVKRHLVSDVPVGAFLSGGIDSPLVVAKMRAVTTGDIRAFTIGTQDEITDESKDAREYARDIGVLHTVEYVDSNKAIELLDDVIEACGEPFGDYSIFPTMMVSQLSSQDYKVMLSGDGGDELFWGYTGRFGPLIKKAEQFRKPYWYCLIKGIMQRMILGRGYSLRYLGKRPLGECHRNMLTHLSEKWMRRIFPSLPEWPANFPGFSYNCADTNAAAQISRWNEFVYHLPWVLMKVDRASMYHSQEVRVPLLDRDVIKVATQIDWREALDLEQMIGKLPLRRTLGRYTKYQTHGKRGFEVPMGAWLKTFLRERLEDSLFKRDDILGVEMRKKPLREFFSLHLTGRQNLAWGLWPLLSLALWVNAHYSSGPSIAR